MGALNMCVWRFEDWQTKFAILNRLCVCALFVLLLEESIF